jgi:hypothetical protein
MPLEFLFGPFSCMYVCCSDSEPATDYGSDTSCCHAHHHLLDSLHCRARVPKKHVPASAALLQNPTSGLCSLRLLLGGKSCSLLVAVGKLVAWELVATGQRAIEVEAKKPASLGSIYSSRVLVLLAVLPDQVTLEEKHNPCCRLLWHGCGGLGPCRGRHCPPLSVRQGGGRRVW